MQILFFLVGILIQGLATAVYIGVDAGAGPRHMTFHPSGRYLYLLNEYDGAIYAFAHDGPTGRLERLLGHDRVPSRDGTAGERGSGEFREATWDEVLDKVSGDLRTIGDTYGWDSIHVFGQVPGSGYIQKGANYRACALLGMSHGTSFDFNGDLPMGMPITL